MEDLRLKHIQFYATHWLLCCFQDLISTEQNVKGKSVQKVKWPRPRACLCESARRLGSNLRKEYIAVLAEDM